MGRKMTVSRNPNYLLLSAITFSLHCLSEVSLASCTDLSGLGETLKKLYRYLSVIIQILNCDMKL